jgi:hypothetical protein
MSRKPISQRETRSLKLRVHELESLEERRRNAWANSYPGGTHIATIETTDVNKATIHTAKLLGHATVLVRASDARLHVYALPIRSKP